MRLTAFLASLVLAASAFAAQEGWTPAPVPGTATGEPVLPADRAGVENSPARDAPFSSIPTGSTAAGGATSSNQVPDAGTPSLSK